MRKINSTKLFLHINGCCDERISIVFSFQSLLKNFENNSYFLRLLTSLLWKPDMNSKTMRWTRRTTRQFSGNYQSFSLPCHSPDWCAGKYPSIPIGPDIENEAVKIDQSPHGRWAQQIIRIHTISSYHSTSPSILLPPSSLDGWKEGGRSEREEGRGIGRHHDCRRGFLTSPLDR